MSDLYAITELSQPNAPKRHLYFLLVSVFNFKLISLYGHIPPSLSPRSAADSAPNGTYLIFQSPSLFWYSYALKSNITALSSVALATGPSPVGSVYNVRARNPVGGVADVK